MKVLIGTANPGKIEGARQAFEKFYEDVEIEGIKVSSDVPDEPVNEQILQGAKNRVENLIKYDKENNVNADFYIAIIDLYHPFYIIFWNIFLMTLFLPSTITRVIVICSSNTRCTR